MSLPHISIHIVVWNSMQFIPVLLESIMSQSYGDMSVLIIDNGSTDGIEGFLKEKYPEVRYLRNARNLGLSSAHNQGIRYTIEHWNNHELNQNFILVMNPNVILTPSFLEELVLSTKGKETYGSFGGKLLQAFGDGIVDEVLKSAIHSDLIDSTGFQLRKNLACIDRGAGEMDKGQYDVSEEVFGFSCTLVLYRAKALELIRFQDEFFDHDFFTYKEDEDLAWRLRCAGLSAWYQSSAIAYHHRGMYGVKKMGWISRVWNRRKESKLRRYYSTRNHWLLLIKQTDVLLFLFLFPRLCIAECARFIYILLFEGSNRRSIFHAIILVPRMFKKRQVMKNTRQISGYAIRKRFAK